MITDLLTNLAQDQVALPETAVPEQVDTEFSDVVLAILTDNAAPKPVATEPSQPMLPIAFPPPPLQKLGSPALHGDQLIPTKKILEIDLVGGRENGSNPDAGISIPQANLNPPYPEDAAIADFSAKESIVEIAVSALAKSQTNRTSIPSGNPISSSANVLLPNVTATNPKEVSPSSPVPTVLPLLAPATGSELNTLPQPQVVETPDKGTPVNVEIPARPDSGSQTIATSKQQPVPLAWPENPGTVTSVQKIPSNFPIPVEPVFGASTTATYPNGVEKVSIKPGQDAIALKSQPNPSRQDASTPPAAPLTSLEIDSLKAENTAPRTLSFPARGPSIQPVPIAKPLTSAQPIITNQRTNSPLPTSTPLLPEKSAPKLEIPVQTAYVDSSATIDTGKARLEERVPFSPIQFRETIVNTPVQDSPVPNQPRLDHGPQVAAAIAQAATALGQQPVELLLNPEELGRVRLTLHTTEGSMAVSVAVERPETLELLRRHIDLLANQLRDIGFDDLSFNFAHDNEGTQTEDDPNAPPPQGFQIGQNEEPMPTARIVITPENGIDIRL